MASPSAECSNAVPEGATVSVRVNIAPARVPRHLVFVWFGERLPVFARVAIQSALRHNPAARVSLLHGEPSADFTALAAHPRLQLRPIDIRALLESARRSHSEDLPALDTERLLAAWHALRTPAARSNLVRLLVLYAEGGVYLDTDTLTLRSLDPLLDRSAFCGVEHILWPHEKLRPSHLHFWLRSPALMGARYLLGNVAYGYRVHRRMLPLYDLAVNNAVLGFSPGHPVLRRALQRITKLRPREWARRFRLGTHLLQEVLTDPSATSANERVERLSPGHFYPLGPVMSSHYFRSYPDAARLARELLSEQTYVVHWYASVSNLLPLGEDYIRTHADRVLFAHLCRRILDEP